MKAKAKVWIPQVRVSDKIWDFFPGLFLKNAFFLIKTCHTCTLKQNIFKLQRIHITM